MSGKPYAKLKKTGLHLDKLPLGLRYRVVGSTIIVAPYAARVQSTNQAVVRGG
jgi:hypothetical protein